eukprot:3608467-Pyramimonas_sp.AAC.1
MQSGAAQSMLRATVHRPLRLKLDKAVGRDPRQHGHTETLRLHRHMGARSTTPRRLSTIRSGRGRSRRSGPSRPK